jgi:hypothetical protein
VGQYPFEPGPEMQHDTSPHRVVIVGQERLLHRTSRVLCHPRMIFAQAYPRWTRHSARVMRALQSGLKPLHGYGPDFMPVGGLWRWRREDVTYNRSRTTRDELIANVRRFEATIHRDPVALSDRLRVKDTLDPQGRKTPIPQIVVL